MAKPQNKTHPTNSCFLGCFGFSSIKTPPEKTSHPGAKSKRSWPKFSLSLRKARHKTVPVDTHPDKASEAADGKSHTSKLIKKKSDTKVISSKPQSTTPVSNYKPSRQSSKAHEQSVAIPSNQAAAREKPKETRLQQGPDQQQNIIIGNRKLSAPTRTSSLTGSPIAKPKPKTNATTKLSHTVSLPAAGGNKRVGNPRIHARTNIKELPRNNNEVVEKLDPLIGMSIIIVTLIIMIVWGRLCAILCTSAWFYFCPRVLRTAINSNNITVTKTATSNDLDLNSEEYKKKVVLEGLLERNHHRLTI